MSRHMTTTARSSRSAQLLRTTALLTLMPLLVATQPAFAQLVLDNGNAPGSTGPTQAVSGNWSMGDTIWRDTDNGGHVALGNGQLGVLTNPAPGPAGVDLTLNGTIDIGGLRVDSDGFTLRGGTLTNSAGALVLDTKRTKVHLTTHSALAGNVIVRRGVELSYHGTSANAGTIAVAAGATLNNTGSITGTINNSGTLTQQNLSTITGKVVNSGTMIMSDTTAAKIDGDVDNTGEIIGAVDGTKLDITGRLTSSGKIDTQHWNDKLTIRANEILITDWRQVNRNDVTLYGTRVNQSNLTYTKATRLAQDVIKGGILNEARGNIRVENNLYGSNFDITNEGGFSIASPGWLTWRSRNTVSDVTKFTNRGANAKLSIGTEATLEATSVENSGTIVNYGRLEARDPNNTLLNNLESGVVTNGGQIIGNVKNHDGATLTNYQTITGDVVNDLGGNLTSSGVIGGDVTNAGNATLSGEITGKLTNTANATGTKDVLDIGRNLTVGGLENSGKITIARGEKLTNNGAAAINTGTGRLDVDGTLTGDVVNSGQLDVTGTIAGHVTHNAGILTSTGELGGLTNNGTSLNNKISGNISGDLINSANAQLTSSATVSGKVDNDGNLTMSGTVTGVLTNKTAGSTANPSLTLGGDLDVGQLVNNASVTIDKNLTLTSRDTATNDGTMTVDGKLAGNISNNGTMNVGGTVTGGITNHDGGKLTSTGTIGALSNYSADAGNTIAGKVTGSVTNREGAVLTSKANVGGDFTNNGTATVSGKITGTLRNEKSGSTAPTLTLGGNLEVGGLSNDASITIDSNRELKLTGSTAADNRGALDVKGKLTGDVDNRGSLDVKGELTGAVENSGTLDVKGEVTGKVTNKHGATLSSTGTIGALENDSDKAAISGMVTGDVDNKNRGILVSSAAIGGDVRNDGTATLSNSVAGKITNDGILTIKGSLTTGENVAVGDPTITNTKTLNLEGSLTGRVQNDKTMNMTGSTLTGSLVNNDRLNLSGMNSIIGDLTSTGTIMGVSTDANLSLSQGTFYLTRGEVNVTAGNTLTIQADMIDIGADADYQNANVTLIGGLANSGTLNLSEADTLEGKLLNRTGGKATISAEVDAAGFDVTNDGDFLLTTDADSKGKLDKVGTLTNSGNFNIGTETSVSAETTKNIGKTMTVGGTLTTNTLTNNSNFNIKTGGSVSANKTENIGGTMTVGGALTTTTLDNGPGATLDLDGGTVTGTVNNTGTVTGNGTIDGKLTNDGKVQVDAGDTLTSTQQVENNKNVKLKGVLKADLLNNKSGEVTMDGGTVSGAVDNRGELTGRGTITGALTNTGSADLGGSLQAVKNDGTLGTNGDLTVASLTNAGTVNIDKDDTLTSTATVDNGKEVNVAGTLNAALNNKQNATTTLNGGTVTGAVTNDGTLTGNGTLEGVLTNNNTATIGGTAAEIRNSSVLTSTSHLTIKTLTNTGTTTVGEGTVMTVTSPLANQGNLNVAGTLVTELTNQSGATTTLTGGGIKGNVANEGDLGGTGIIAGVLTNRDTVTVNDGDALTATQTINEKTLNVAGTLKGTLTNQAGGSTTLTNGAIEGKITNLGTLEGTGTITGTLDNEKTADLAGEVKGTLTNKGMLTIAGTSLSVTTLVNNKDISVSADQKLIVTDNATNEAEGTLALAGKSELVGSITNRGKISGNGTVTGTLTNEGGTLDTRGTMTVGKLLNKGGLTLVAGDTLVSKEQAENTGNLGLLGTLDGDLLNQAGSQITGTGTITGSLTNHGLAQLAGNVGAVTNHDRLETTGKLNLASLTNTGTVTVGTGHELNSKAAVDNASQLKLLGTLSAGLNNQKGATTELSGGTVTGNVVNDGRLTGTGTIKSNLTNNEGGTVAIGGTVGGNLRNDGGTVTANADLQVEGKIVNSAAQGVVTIAKGTQTTAKQGTVNGTEAELRIDGALVSDVHNTGNIVNDGTLTGKVTNLDKFESNGTVNGTVVAGSDGEKLYGKAITTLNGTVSGNVAYFAGDLNLGNNSKITGSLDLLKNYTIADGARVTAGRTGVGSGTTLSFGGTISGNVLNEGKIELTDNSATINGNLENKAVLDLTNRSVGTVLTTKGLSGNGIIMLDVSTGENLLADKVVVAGGATTGHITLQFKDLSNMSGSAIGKSTTLVDVDSAFKNTYTYAAEELAASSERIVYSVERASNGDIQLVSQINPAIGAMFANVTLVQSLIGSVINRPTSPYVTGLVTDYADKPCGVGGWGRGTGGHATVRGKTDNQISVAENEVSASYYGMQGGLDLICFDDRYAGWDLSFGVLAGVNTGDSRQPIFAIDSRNSQATTGVLASITTTDFQQVYGGVYMTGTKGRWTADLQLRGERTDFELKNAPVRGSGLQIETPDFTSDGVTLSGSLAYSMPVKDTGWIFTPNVGFSWSKYSTESIRFDGDFLLEFDDSERQVGFVGASIGKTFVYESQNAAVHTFATATYFKDFADNAVSRLHNASLEGYETQVLTSENLKNYGEVSIGANYVKVLNPGKSGRPRQLSTSARIDGRFGDSIDSVGVTGQFRLQF